MRTVMVGMRRTLAIAVVGMVVLLGASASVYAQARPTTAPNTKGAGNGLKIYTVKTDIIVDKGNSRTVSVTVENITGSPVTVTAVTNDFVPSADESGEPRIILDEKQRAPGNSFKSLISTLPTVTLAPSEKREVKITLSVPTNASSGGYYGAVRFSPGTGENDKNVALTASVGSIFLVRVPGDITEKLSVEGFTVLPIKSCDGGTATRPCTPVYGGAGSLFSNGPVAIETRFRNFGNIHVQPFGKISIKNFSGKIIQEIEINNSQPRGSVLPASIRKFTLPVSEKKLFGKYTAEASFGYGSNGELLLAKKTFYVIPFKLIALVLGVLIFAIFILPRLIRSYNDSVIRRSKQNRRK